MDVTITRLTFVESGGFAGLQRGCTLEPATLPAVLRFELQSLVQQTSAGQGASAPHRLSDAPVMPDMQTYTLELVLQASPGTAGALQHRVLRYPASDVPEDLSALIGFLRGQARPLDPQ